MDEVENTNSGSCAKEKNELDFFEQLEIHRPISIDVDKIVAVYKGCENLSDDTAFYVGYAHQPSGLPDIKIMDRYGGLRRGTNRVYLTPTDPVIYRPYPAWATKDIDKENTYLLEPTIHPQTYFKRCSDWKKELDILFYQGFRKDPRLVRTAKTWAIDLPDIPNLWQKYNPHSMLFTQTGTGKSGLAENVLGIRPIKNPTPPGLFGGGCGQNRKEGLLNGSGLCMFDEINTEETHVLDELLNYSEQGTTERAIHGGMVCRGTKTLSVCGNPLGNSEILLGLDFQSILKSIAGSESDVKRLGRRMGGTICYGIDYVTTSGDETFCVENQERIDIIRDVIRSATLLNKKGYGGFLKGQLGWLNLPDGGYTKDLESIASGLTDKSLYNFVMGMGLATARVRMAALRLALIENIDHFVLDGPEALAKSEPFCNEREANYSFFKGLNKESAGKLKAFQPLGTYEEFEQLYNIHKDLRFRSDAQLAMMFGISAMHMGRWRRRTEERGEYERVADKGK